MSRALRIQYPGAIYHITSRRNGGNKIFQDKEDYLMFLEELKEVIEYNNWISYNKSKENIKKERFAGRPSLENIFKSIKEKTKRDNLIYKSFKEHGYTQTEIGKCLKLHYSTVSRIIDKAKEKIN